MQNQTSHENNNSKHKIIDAHAHLGNFYDGLWNREDSYTPEQLINITQSSDYNVEKVLVSNLSCISTLNNEKDAAPRMNETDGNNELLEFCKYNNKLIPTAVCQPGFGNAKNIDNLLNKHNEFKALKFHPEALNLDANDEKYEDYLKVAQKHSLPCVFHSAPGKSDPTLIYNLAKKFSKVPVILYHMNLPAGIQEHDLKLTYHRNAIQIVKSALDKKDANLYLETSWAEPEAIVEAISEIGADRIMFGSDAPIDKLCNQEAYAQEIEKIKKAISEKFGDKAEEIINKIFYQNSKNLFFEKSWINTENIIKATLVGIGAALLGFLAVKNNK